MQKPGQKLTIDVLEDRITPATTAISDNYQVPLGQVLNVPFSQGLLSNDFNTTNPGSVLSAAVLGLPTFVPITPVVGQALDGPVAPLPAGSLRVNPDGSFTFLAPTTIPNNALPVVQFNYQATASNGETSFFGGQVRINLLGQRQRFIAAAADAGGGPRVNVYDAGTNALVRSFFPYESTFTGGVRVTVGDFNNDGVDDIITVPATGGGPRVRVFSGNNGNILADFFAYESSFRGGGYVAIGDINGDGGNDIVVGAGEGGGPRVRIFSRARLVPDPVNPTPRQFVVPIADFFAYDTNDRFGVRVAAGNLDGSGRDSVVTAPGAGGGPRINVYPGIVATSTVRNLPFTVFPPNVILDPAVAPPPAGTPTTDTSVSGSFSVVNFAAPAFSFFSGDSADRSGVNIALGDLRGDGLRDIVTGTGAGAGIVRVYDGRTAGFVRQFNAPTGDVPTGSAFIAGITQGGGQALNGSLLGGIAPSTLAPSGVGTGPGAGQGGVRVAATDFNKDGLDDIVTGTGPGVSPSVRVFDTKLQTQITQIQPFEAGFLGGVQVAASQGASPPIRPILQTPLQIFVIPEDAAFIPIVP